MNLDRTNRTFAGVDRRHNANGLVFNLSRPERRAERPRITALLHSSNGDAVRMLCAPAGSGKTAAALLYAERTGAEYISVRRHVAPTCSDARALIDWLPPSVSEVILDDFDSGAPKFIDTLVDAIASGSTVRRYVLCGRSRLRMRASRLLAVGAARMFDGAALAFTSDEAARLAQRLGISYDDEDLTQLLHDTDGWPIALHSVMRDCAEGSRRLRGAFETWRQGRGFLLSEYLAGEYEADADALLQYMVMLRRGFTDGEYSLERFEALGFPIVRSRASLRPYRVMSRIANEESESSDAPGVGSRRPLMTLKLLGRFSCQIDGRPLTFVRRRDQNVLTFVALAPDGRVSRRALIEAFWPDVDRISATGNLRTTLSRIRKAIAVVAGPANVDTYFRSADDVCLDREHVVLDVRRFLEHHAFGQLAEAKSDTMSAKRCYAAADRLYSDRLLASEPVEPCFEAHVRELEDLYTSMLSRLVALHTTTDEEAAALAYSKTLMRHTGPRRTPIESIVFTGSRAEAI